MGKGVKDEGWWAAGSGVLTRAEGARLTGSVEGNWGQEIREAKACEVGEEK